MEFLAIVPLCGIYVVFYAIFMAVIFLRKRWLQHRKYRSPFTENFLRNPGESLIKQIEEINNDISYYLTISFFSPMMVYSLHISQSYFGGFKESLFQIFLSFSMAIILTTVSTVLLIKSLNRRRNLRLGYDGELAVGQELNQLMRDGYHVFHDFPGEKFNIDHIVVGRSGVFAVETKARSKPVIGDKRAEAEVIYDGNCLMFPKWKETKPIEQAINQAKWLSKYLSDAVGEKIEAKPVVALPGWYVKRTSSHGIPVVNPKAFYSLLKNSDLSDSMIKRIAYQLNQKCRNVEPKHIRIKG